MPAVIPIAVAAGTAIAGAYSAHKQSESTDNAAAIKAKSDAAALALATQQENTRKQEYDQQQALLKSQWDAQQQIRAPYRAAGANALSTIGNMLGVDFGSGYTGPTPSTPATFGQPTTPSQPAVSGGPSPVNPSAFNMAAFNQGAQSIQQTLSGSPAGTVTPPAAAAPSTNPTDEAGILAALTKNYAALGVTPTGPGTGPTDLQYYAGKVLETGGLTPDNVNFWFGPSGRIATDLAKAKSGATTTKTAAAAPLGLTPPTPLNLAPGNVLAPGYAPIVPISGLMGRGPYQ